MTRVPWAPTPIQARFNLSLGGGGPPPPRTCLGTIRNGAAAAAAVSTLRRETVVLLMASSEISVQLIHHTLHTHVRIAPAFVLDRINALVSRIFRRFHALGEIEFGLVALRVELQPLGVANGAGKWKQQLQSILTSGLVREIAEIRQRAAILADSLE